MDEEVSIMAILQRIRGWKIQIKELNKELSTIQKRINEAQTTLEEMLDAS